MLCDEAKGFQHCLDTLVLILVLPLKWIGCLHA